MAWSSATSPRTVPRRHSRGSELDRRSDALALELREQGVGFGDRLGIAMPNSLHLVLASVAAVEAGRDPGARALGPPRLGTRPPARDRRRRGVSRRVGHLRRSTGGSTSGWPPATIVADLSADLADDLADVVSPSLMGICSSGSTGMPKVIVINRPAVYHDVFSTPMIAMWGPVPTPQTILVVAPMYHSTGFTHAEQHARRRSPRDHAEVRRGADRRRHRTPPRLHVHGDADDVEADLRPARHRRARPVEHRMDPAGRSVDATEPRRAVDRTDRCRTDPDGLRNDRGARDHGTARRRVARTPWQRRPAAAGHRSQHSGAGRHAAPDRRGRRHLHAGAGVRRVDVPRRWSTRTSPPTGSPPSATWATSTRTATCTSPTVAST